MVRHTSTSRQPPYPTSPHIGRIDRSSRGAVTPSPGAMTRPTIRTNPRALANSQNGHVDEPPHSQMNQYIQPIYHTQHSRYPPVTQSLNHSIQSPQDPHMATRVQYAQSYQQHAMLMPIQYPQHYTIPFQQSPSVGSMQHAPPLQSELQQYPSQYTEPFQLPPQPTSNQRSQSPEHQVHPTEPQSTSRQPSTTYPFTSYLNPTSIFSKMNYDKMTSPEQRQVRLHYYHHPEQIPDRETWCDAHQEWKEVRMWFDEGVFSRSRRSRESRIEEVGPLDLGDGLGDVRREGYMMEGAWVPQSMGGAAEMWSRGGGQESVEGAVEGRRESSAVFLGERRVGMMSVGEMLYES